MICHITTRSAWEAAQAGGSFTPPEFGSFGFVHCSTPEQVLMVANAFFAGRSGLVLLVIDPAKLKSPVRWEPPHALGTLPNFTKGSVFPHVHGPINVDAVVRTTALEPNEKGAFILQQPG